MAKEPYCKNCRLFDPINHECQVLVLHEGEKYKLPVYPNDKCFFENTFIAKKPVFNKKGECVGEKEELFKPEVNEVKFWVEDEMGNKTRGDGVVKIQYPKGFFGVEDK